MLFIPAVHSSVVQPTENSAFVCNYLKLIREMRAAHQNIDTLHSLSCLLPHALTPAWHEGVEVLHLSPPVHHLNQETFNF